MSSPAVDSITDAVAAMRERAAVCRTLYGGTIAMRAAGKAYLPQWPQETDDAWRARKDCTSLFPAFKKAIGVMVGKPLGSEIGVGDDVPNTIEATFSNIDRQGRDLDAFARDVALSCLRDGITWVLADYPRVPKGATLATERALGARPYLIHIPLGNVLGWQRDKAGNLVQFRYLETVEIPYGPWATQTLERVRVWSPGRVEVYEKTETTAWTLVDEAETSLKEIPVVAVYGQREGLWSATPPLEDLAWKNIQHWQSESDQRNILHVARVPFLAGDEDARSDPNAPVTIGTGGMLVGIKGLRFVEHSGAAIGAGRQDLIDLEDQMQRIAGELLSRVVQKTATESDREGNEGESWLRAWARTFEDALEECLRMMGLWIGEAQGGTLSLDFDWNDTTLAADMITALTNARTSGNLSREAYLTKMQEGGVLPVGRTIQQEMDAQDVEGPQGFGNVDPLGKSA